MTHIYNSRQYYNNVRDNHRDNKQRANSLSDHTVAPQKLAARCEALAAVPLGELSTSRIKGVGNTLPSAEMMGLDGHLD